MILDHTYEIDSVFEYMQDRKVMLIPILKNPTLHPTVNSVCAIYIYTEDDVERIIPINHYEQINGFTDHLQRFLQLENIFVHDKKTWLQIGGNGNVLDIKTLWWYTYGETYDETYYPTPTHTFYWRRHQSLPAVNSIVPLQKHLEMCQKIRHYAWPMCVNAKLDASFLNFNNLYPKVFAEIESAGLYVNAEFKLPELITNNFVYSNYNYHTTTGRPSNAYRGFNYAAMNKEDGTRSAFCSRFDNGALVEMDFDSYHIRLIARLIGYPLPTTSIHEYLGKFYFDTTQLTDTQREESKQITFRLMYGGIDREFLQIPFFDKVNTFVYTLWNQWKTKRYIETPITKRKLLAENLKNMTANKLFNYYLQAVETEVSVQKLSALLTALKPYESRIVLYTYDSILLDVNYAEAKEILPICKNILEQGNFPVKCKVGDIYDKMNQIAI